ncbi:MAG: family 20 glycosylhydrolase [Cyclobacteriaceae bacterium]|nr:family 20 glycosylhydrolase [Cyclobacteriaceae bacterium]
MKKIFKPLLALVFMVLALNGQSQTKLDSLMPIRGFCIGAPAKEDIKDFIKFIDKEFVPRKINTLVLRVDFRYEYETHPELRSENPLTKADIKKLVEACKKANIRLIPQVNLLGHQSWASNVGKLLEVYPQFDETPHVEFPEEYKWPNADGLYCKSYCPLHPEVHEVVFDIVDEIVEVFETDAFHAGMDEVFYIGDDKCPRCSGRDKAELFAGEVTKIRNHLLHSNTELWIWGDRLIDGKTTGIGVWEASMNNTHRAIDMIPKDVVINDWHYVRAVPTAAYFAVKGFRVVSCPWRYGHVATAQVRDMVSGRQNSTPQTGENFHGMMQTIWTSPRRFMDQFYGKEDPAQERGGNVPDCFRELFDTIGELEE